MWPNGDNNESGAYRARRRFVTVAAHCNGCSPAHRQRTSRGAVMSAPTLDRTPAASTSSPAARRSRRPLLLLVATSLVLVAAAVGTSVALANRPVTGQPSVAVDTPGPVTPGVVTPDQPADQRVGQNTTPEQNTEPGPGVTDVATPVLPDGPHDAYIRQVDKGRNRIVVDVVQVFHDDAAVEAAIADGQSR